jgi:hypothetical protein
MAKDSLLKQMFKPIFGIIIETTYDKQTMGRAFICYWGKKSHG